MRFARFFVDRPIFATVLSIFVMLLGGIAYSRLPVAQFPEVAPPTVVVSAQYPGTPPTATNGGCLMLTGVNVAAGQGDGSYLKVVPAAPGTTFAITVATTNPALLGLPYLVAIDAFTPNGAFDLPPAPFGLPDLWIGPSALVVLNGSTQGFVLVPGGNHLHFTVPPGLSGFHLMLQAATSAPGGYCATDAHELVFQ